MPACVEHQGVRKNERVIEDREPGMLSYERDVLWTHAGEVELAGDERRQLNHRFVDHGDDQSSDAGWPTEIRREVGIPGEHPATVRFVGHEPKRPIPHGLLVPARLAYRS